MNIKTGIDIVYLPKFKKSLKTGGEKFLQRIFLPEELNDQRVMHLAGIFAAKEAVMKALGLLPDSWYSIKVVNLPSGAPKVEIENYKLKIENYSLSLSHDGNYVIACFVALLK